MARVPEGTCVWAVGDVHGRADLLDALLLHIGEDLRTGAAHRRVLVMLGDYVDRGAGSRAVIERLVGLKAWQGVEVHLLRGNHDDWMLRFLDDPALGVAWCEHGGRETLWSYGVEPPRPGATADDWRAASDRLIEAMPQAHRAFLEDLELSVEIGDYFFAHAGARAGVPLSDQAAEDLMWIRAEFIGGAAPFERMVVHGHTPEEAAHADHRRIGIDTGAYATNVLTGLRLEGADRQLAQTRPGGVVRRPL
ncbi:MAG: serine/threonine protein phosphatase [Brevundimonas sp.]|nr:MAG: serine/threonine protein phosphatase [Brevundimonas sp.]